MSKRKSKIKKVKNKRLKETMEKDENRVIDEQASLVLKSKLPPVNWAIAEILIRACPLICTTSEDWGYAAAFARLTRFEWAARIAAASVPLGVVLAGSFATLLLYRAADVPATKLESLTQSAINGQDKVMHPNALLH